MTTPELARDTATTTLDTQLIDRINDAMHRLANVLPPEDWYRLRTLLDAYERNTTQLIAIENQQPRYSVDIEDCHACNDGLCDFHEGAAHAADWFAETFHRMRTEHGREAACRWAETYADGRTTVATGLASRPGTADPSGDAAMVHGLADQTTAAAVVDGIGHSERVASMADLLARVAARITARRGPLAGLLAAAELIADSGSSSEPDAVAVAAVTAPGDGMTRIAWIGDARAWGWDGTTLRQYSTDLTMGQWLRANGNVPAEIAEHHDAWVRASLATAVVASIRETEIPDQMVILTSDGVHDQVPHDVLEALVRAHEDAPQDLADALVAAARPDGDGARDDATAVVLLHQRDIPPC